MREFYFLALWQKILKHLTEDRDCSGVFFLGGVGGVNFLGENWSLWLRMETVLCGVSVYKYICLIIVRLFSVDRWSWQLVVQTALYRYTPPRSSEADEELHRNIYSVFHLIFKMRRCSKICCFINVIRGRQGNTLT